MNNIILEKEYKDIIGMEVLKFPESTIVMVTNHPEMDAVGEALMIVSACHVEEGKKKLISLSNGEIWGDQLHNYTFELFRGVLKLEVK